MNQCSACGRLVESTARVKAGWHCIECLADQIREAEALIVQTESLNELIEKRNEELLSQAKPREDLITLLMNQNELLERELLKYHEAENESKLAE